VGRRRFTEQDYDDWVRRYQRRRQALETIAAAYDCDRSTVYRALVKRGVTMRPKRGPYVRIKPANVIKFAAANPGLSVNQIAARLGCGRSTVHKVLAEHGA
jgi:predicted transcriptional regulator